MAPEQSQGKSVDQRNRPVRWAHLYECLTSRRAFASATPMEVALKQIKERPVSRQLLSSTPPSRGHRDALPEKEPSRRFASAAE
jgi:hypothetical protein